MTPRRLRSAVEAQKFLVEHGYDRRKWYNWPKRKVIDYAKKVRNERIERLRFKDGARAALMRAFGFDTP